MGVLCARTLKSVYIIADRLSPNTDWSGFSILFFSLFPSNRHPLVLSYVSLIRPITAAYSTEDLCQFTYLHLVVVFRAIVRTGTERAPNVEQLQTDLEEKFESDIKKKIQSC